MLVGKIVKIVYGEEYPFHKPTIKFSFKNDPKYDGYLSMFDMTKLEFKDIMKEDYHPSLNFVEISERAFKFIN